MIYIVASYFLGTFMTAWFIGKVYGINLQNEHSGNLGARNAGRVIGKKAFIFTALGDVLKGVVVVAIGRYFGMSELMIGWALFAVVCGHLYPFWLKGKGGKAVATVLGGLLIFSWQASLVFIASLLLFLLVKRSVTLGFIVGLIAYSTALVYLQVDGFWPVLAAIALVIWKHRSNIVERVT